MCHIGCVRFAGYCGQMYRRHLFSYGGLWSKVYTKHTSTQSCKTTPCSIRLTKSLGRSTQDKSRIAVKQNAIWKHCGVSRRWAVHRSRQRTTVDSYEKCFKKYLQRSWIAYYISYYMQFPYHIFFFKDNSYMIPVPNTEEVKNSLASLYQ